MEIGEVINLTMLEFELIISSITEGIEFLSQAVGATYDNSTKEYISGSILEHCHLIYAGDSAALKILNGHFPFVNHVNISRCKGYGIEANQVQNALKIFNANVEYCNSQRYSTYIVHSSMYTLF
jgi:hypothetical protein